MPKEIRGFGQVKDVQNSRELQELRQGLIQQMQIQSLEFTGNLECSWSDLDMLVLKDVPGVSRDIAKQLLGLEDDFGHVLEPILDTIVPIAITPAGNADSPVGEYFAKAFTAHETVRWLLDKLAENDGHHYYMQSQDNNLKELSNLSIPQFLPQASKGKFIGQQAAANLWIGGIGTTSRLHNDNYDNIYIQIQGTKRIWLLPPSDVYALNEQFLVPATYDSQMSLKPDLQTERVLFPTVNPSDPSTHNSVYSEHASARFIDVHAGDVVFIPALWYHQVEIVSSEVNISVNYWHEPLAGDRKWAQWDFLRRTSLIARGIYDESYFYSDEEIS